MAGRTERNGYGIAHQKRRERLARTVAAGEAVCWRCGKPIEPGQPWDLGHHDLNRSVYMGPEHRGCNRAVKTHRAARASSPRGTSARQPTQRARALAFFD